MRKKALFFTILTIAVMLAVFIFSSQNGDESGALSGKIADLARKIVSRVLPDSIFRDKLLNNMHFLVRKAAHVTIYLVMAICMTMSIHYWGAKNSITIVAAFLLCVIFASTDEFHQSFVSGRGASWKDVLIDSCGVLVGTAIPSLIILRKNKKE